MNYQTVQMRPNYQNVKKMCNFIEVLRNATLRVENRKITKQNEHELVMETHLNVDIIVT